MLSWRLSFKRNVGIKNAVAAVQELKSDFIFPFESYAQSIEINRFDCCITNIYIFRLSSQLKILI
jgi:hypothetical protein